MKHIAYIRVSSTDQNLDRQRDIITEDMKVFEDKCSGSTINRPGLTALMDWVRDGDHVHVHSIDRMARDLFDLQKLVQAFQEQGVDVTFHKENLRFKADASDPMSTLMLQIFGAVAQFERARIRDRQAEGIAKAKAKSVYKGRKPTAINKSDLVMELKREGKKNTEIAREAGIGIASVYRILKANKEQAGQV